MKLELLVEEQTPQTVIEPLVECIQRRFPQITAVSTARYTFPCKRTIKGVVAR